MSPRLQSLVALSPLLLLAGYVHAEQTLDPVLVTATRQPIRASEVLSDVTVIERAEIERNGQGTVTDLLARQPGIQISSNGGPGTLTSFYIRGANSNQTKVLVDGIPLNSTDASGSPLRFISLSDVERIEILRGPAATLYGADAIGGIIHVITRRGKPGLKADGFIGYGTRNTAQGNAGVSGGNEQWRFRLEGNHVSTDGFSAQRNARNRDADKDGYRNNGGGASLSFLPATGHEIGLTYRRNEGIVHYDSGNVPADGDYNDRQRFEIEQWSAFSKNRIVDIWESTLHYSESKDYQRSFSWDAWAYPAATEVITKFNTRNKQISWQNDISLPLGKVLLATERLEQSVSPRADYGSRPEISNNSILAGWSGHTGRHRWQLNARHDNHSEFSSENTYGLAYGYQLTQAWRAHASYGTAFKAPSVYQLFMTSPWGHGNPDLRPEKSRNRELALIWESGRHSVSGTYYLNNVSNLIDWVSEGPPAWTGTYENVSRARLEGITMTYSGRFDDWSVQASYDWLDAKNEDSNMRLGRRARNKAVLAISRHWGALETGGELIAVGKRYDTNNETGEMPGYGLVNLTARYAITQALAVEGRINNLFDKEYDEAKGYGTPGFNAFIGLRYSLQ